MSALKTHLNKRDYFTKQNIALPDLRTVLDLVALGTVADVVNIWRVNKYDLDYINMKIIKK
jgi:single-stranded-DNA-specific exonuclease